MNYETWLTTVPEAITDDPLWSMKVYRLALFLGDIAWRDVTKLAGDRRTRGLSNQLYEAVGSVGANVAEGYGRGTGKDRARFYEYALGSARESRHWYHEGRHVLGDPVTQHRIDLLAEIIRLLLAIIPAQRGRKIRESSATYDTIPSDLLTDVPFTEYMIAYRVLCIFGLASQGFLDKHQAPDEKKIRNTQYGIRERRTSRHSGLLRIAYFWSHAAQAPSQPYHLNQQDKYDI